MTVRGNKRLLQVALGAIAIAFALNLWRAFGPGGHGLADFTDLVPFVAFAALLTILWRRLRVLEAEHGPDYVIPQGPNARWIVVAAGVATAALSALATYLMLHRS